MMPASSEPSRSSSRQIRKWAPLGAVAAIAIGVGTAVAVGGGGDDDDDAGAVTTTVSADAGTSASTDTTVTGQREIDHPLSWTQAQESGIAIDLNWGERCDTTRGLLAVPNFFAAECYAPFSGDNGGATAPGVTADTITVAVYQGQENDPIINYIADAVQVDDTNDETWATMQGIVDYYEAYYELYGRRIELVRVDASGSAIDPIAARADAVRIATEIQPFAVLNGPALTNAFADELAANGILCISCTPGQPPDWYVERDPYVFGLGMSGTQGYAHAHEFVTTRLAGQNAVHGGDAVAGQPRVFGLVYIESSELSKQNADEFVANLTADGVAPAAVVSYVLDPATLQENASSIIARMKEAGVTTVLLATDPVAPRELTREATVQEYFPEWVVIGTGNLTDVTAFGRTYDQEQWRHAFGITLLAARQDPTVAGPAVLYEWFTGEAPPAADSIGTFSPAPALFFAVLQGVGPDLTAENFRAALFASDATPRALTQPSLSWGAKPMWPGIEDYQGVDDMTAIWWDPDATGPDEIQRDGQGMYRYQERGRRFLPGEWTPEDTAFVVDGSITIFEDPPAEEIPPDYPSPAGG
jgi:hypothetical protein